MESHHKVNIKDHTEIQSLMTYILELLIIQKNSTEVVKLLSYVPRTFRL